MRSGTRASAAALGIVAVLGLSACALTDGGDEEAEQTSSEATAAETSAQEGSAAEDAPEGDDAEEDDVPAAGPAEDTTPDPDEAIQTVTYAMTGPTEGEMTMALHGVEVGEEGMLITVTFTPEYEQDGEPAHFIEAMHNPSRANIATYLMPVVSDRENLKAYYVPVEVPERAGGGWGTRSDNAWASDVDVHVHSGDTLTMWAYVPTPEDDIDTVDVSVVPGAPEFRDVEIEWGDHSPADHSGSGNEDEDEYAEDDDE